MTLLTSRRLLAGCLFLGLLVLVVSQASADAPPRADGTALDAAALARRIDAALARKVAADRVAPSPRADDAEFLRRACLDLTGVIPTPERAAAFLDTSAPDKRARLVDELLASPSYGRHMADLWQRLMVPRDSDNRRLQPQPLAKWLEERFNANTPWNLLVRDLLTATGPQDANGAVTYFLANASVDKMTDSVSKLFLGLQLQCAQCHNHPFTRDKQDDYWALAAFFTKVRPDNVKKAAKQGGSPAIAEDGRGKARLPESARTVPARFLHGDQPDLKRQEPYRPVLADWMTSPKNPFFARAAVNRFWAQMFGRGLVNPVDDMHEGNAPSHPELLQDLADTFVASNFDLKGLLRALALSEAYNRSSKPAPGATPELQSFAVMAVKSLAPEQLYDSLTQVLGNAARPAAQARKAKQQQMMKGAGAGPREQFIAFFEGDETAKPTDYQAGIPQALRLMNAPQMKASLAVAAAVNRDARTPDLAIEQLYLSSLSRRPTAEEKARLNAFVQKAGGPSRDAYADILWVLLNSSEFALNH